MEISILIAVGGLLLSAVTFFCGRQSAAHKKGEQEGSVLTEIKYIKESVTRIETQFNGDTQRIEGKVDAAVLQIVEIAAKSSRAYESVKMEHNRLNEHLAREHGKAIVKDEIA